MGSCASVHNKGNPDSGIKMGMSFGSKKDKLMIPESPIKNKLSAVDLPAKTAFKDNGTELISGFILVPLSFKSLKTGVFNLCSHVVVATLR
uniref:Uncharacterized protein n=1 Tax=Rhizophora mucronata TaxID=61149 RepID=A0A2P2JK85_RHIMU